MNRRIMIQRVVLVGVVAALAAGPLIISGCKTTPTPENIANFVADARDIAELGTRSALLENQNFRKELTITRDALNTLASQPDGAITADGLLQALSNLPIKDLHSEKGLIYVTGGKIIIRRFLSWINKPEIDVTTSGYIKQFAVALRDGIDAGLKT